jgi:ankyrin repeat protein
MLYESQAEMFISSSISFSQDVVISVLFPYCLPSFPIVKKENWSNQDIRLILQHLLVYFCNIPMKATRNSLEIFTRRMLFISSNCKRNLDDDLCFLADIEQRCSFNQFHLWGSGEYSLYASSFLIQHKADLDHKDFALILASGKGHKPVVTLLLQLKADVHTQDDYPVRLAAQYGHKDVIALLIEHKANVHAHGNFALLLANTFGHKEVVNLVLKHMHVGASAPTSPRTPPLHH